MTKLRGRLFTGFLLLLWIQSVAQGEYSLQVNAADRDSNFLATSLGLQKRFGNRNDCINYINQLQARLHAMGYVTASLDSVLVDSATASLYLFVGEKYEWGQINTGEIDPLILQSIGWRDRLLTKKAMDFSEIQRWQERMLAWLENNGYPFAKVYLDSLSIDSGIATARFRLEKGPSYKIDSIRVLGNVKIDNEFLQRYLDIRNGSLFSREKVKSVGPRLKNLAFVEEEFPSRLVLLSTGAYLELYLRQKRSSQVNLLVGFLPNNDQLSNKKLLITGEANLNLKNALGSGETIGLNWQQLQVKSPRLNMFYRHPYLFKTPVGLDFSFDMFRKDSTFLNVNFQIGAQYVFTVHQSGKLFLQRSQSIVNGVNKNFILQNYKLPDEADLSSVNVGIDYDYNNKDYRANPRKGNELRIITAVGVKRIRRNNEVLELKDPGNPSFDFGTLYDTIKAKSYQLNMRVSAARFFPLGRQGGRTTFKSALNGGMLQSGNIFRNELFQVGGYKLLRGFDEESQYLSQFLILTGEFRYLVGQNSYFYAFVDGGWGKNKSQNANDSYGYLSSGLGLAFETQVGIFNLAWAVGKRSDQDFNLRQSKIHFGFVNYF